MTKIVNLVGGPGSGKSTLAHGVMALLKSDSRVRAEYVPEHAKELVWDGYDKVSMALAQRAIMEEQERRIRRLLGRVDIVIQDTSLLLGLHYGREQLGEAERRALTEIHDTYDNFNVFVVRRKAYRRYGRVETEEQAHDADAAILSLYADRLHMVLPGEQASALRLYERLTEGLPPPLEACA